MPSRQRHWGGWGISWWACWQDTFWLGRWLLSRQPPPLPLFPTHLSRTWTRPAGLTAVGHRPLYPSRTRVESLSCQRTLPRRNLPLQPSFNLKFVIASASRASSSSWLLPLVPSPFVLVSSARQFQVSYCLSFRVHSFSRLRPVGPPSSRLVTASGAVTPQGTAGQRP